MQNTEVEGKKNQNGIRVTKERPDINNNVKGYTQLKNKSTFQYHKKEPF